MHMHHTHTTDSLYNFYNIQKDSKIQFHSGSPILWAASVYINTMHEIGKYLQTLTLSLPVPRVITPSWVFETAFPTKNKFTRSCRKDMEYDQVWSRCVHSNLSTITVMSNELISWFIHFFNDAMIKCRYKQAIVIKQLDHKKMYVWVHVIKHQCTNIRNLHTNMLFCFAVALFDDMVSLI